MSSHTASPAPVPATTLLAGAGIATVAAAWLAVSGFAGIVAAALAAVVYSILAGLSLPMRLGAAASTIGYPLLAASYGEDALLWGSTISFLVLAAVSIAGGLGPRLVPSLSLALLVVAYLSALCTHLVLLRQLPRGSAMVTAFLVVAAGYESVASGVQRRIDSPRRSRPLLPDWRAVAAGTAVSCGLIFAARALLDLAVGTAGAAILGVAVAVSAAVGGTVGGLVSDGLKTRLGPGDALALRHLNAVLVAAPAFYYGLRLYLT